MTQYPKVKLTPEEEKRWKEIQNFRFPHHTQRRQLTEFFWKKAVEAFGEPAFLCSFILAGITAELAHRTKLLEQGVNMTRFTSWSNLIQKERDKETKKLAQEIKDNYRNVWVHVDPERIEKYLKENTSFGSSDLVMNVANASAMALDPLEKTMQLLARLFAE